MRSKSEILSKFEEFYKEITLKTNITIKRLRSDNAGEYKNKRMSELSEKLKLSQEFTVPYNPEQNGMTERLNRILCEMVRCMLKDSNMANRFWAEAFKTAAYVRNRIKIEDINNGMSPYETTMAKNLIWILCAFLYAIAL
jgi:transposase InsO family protein